MSRTYRRPRLPMMRIEWWAKYFVSKTKVRDGTGRQYDASCRNNGDCDWCSGDRLYSSTKWTTIPIEELMDDW